ncbi:hypothetical protein [Brevibacillus sp. NL20B1]|jgi:hypothetical protein|uniref:hypothetical protein n=1 Tax=Brevibacillus sp. NL20B1 TaxID=2829799 RepID=UPI001B994D58|nr:hypothetical protein [Brevibacillus sp. NL20B1]MBR8661119.1 hypothetical protein [Brevibacillus sp. NL20B1]
MPKLRPRRPDGWFGPLVDVNPGERPPTDRERIQQLERENIDLMLALTQVYEELLALQSGGTT